MPKADLGEKRVCGECGAKFYDLNKDPIVCPKCGAHRPINARTRIRHFLDEDAEQVEIGADVRPTDPLRFRDSKKYRDRLADAQKNELWRRQRDRPAGARQIGAGNGYSGLAHGGVSCSNRPHKPMRPRPPGAV